MDFNDTPEEGAWRAECREWLAANAPEFEGSAMALGEVRDPAELEQAKAWQARKFDHGFARITWEPEYGGRNGTPMQQVIFNQEESHYRVPTFAFVIGVGMIAPTIKAVGTPEQQERYLRPLLRGEEIWCQLFSEPGAGSDVASLATSAVRDGDEWVLNGQKVWTSGAQYSDFGEIICRTSPDAEKHRGITAFVVDMRAPGVEIRPLRQMTGGAQFNEVFFTDVRVPHGNVLGDVDNGWSVAITTLMNERVAIGSGSAGGRGGAKELIALAQAAGVGSDPLLRQRLASVYTKSRIAKFIGMRALTATSKGQVPGPEGSIGKLFGAMLGTEVGDTAMAILGTRGITKVDDDYSWNLSLLAAPASHIAGGTTEVMKNIIGERVLGLPGEPRTDKGVPWKDVPRSS
jgi:alkylation response protein AidB-like acyl-CoA dehydrogenase